MGGGKWFCADVLQDGVVVAWIQSSAVVRAAARIRVEVEVGGYAAAARTGVEVEVFLESGFFPGLTLPFNSSLFFYS